MANPIKAVKAIGRAVGGITGKGSKKVNPIYRQSYRQNEVRIIGDSKKMEIPRAKQILRQAKDEGYLKKPADTAKGNKRGLKAANKPTNKVGSKADKELRASTKSVSASKEQTKAQYDYYYGEGAGDDVTIINKSVTPKNEARSVRTLKPKPRKPRKR